MNKSKKRNTKKRNTRYVYKGGVLIDDIHNITETLNTMVVKAHQYIDDQPTKLYDIFKFKKDSFINDFIIQLINAEWPIEKFLYKSNLYNEIKIKNQEIKDEYKSFEYRTQISNYNFYSKSEFNKKAQDIIRLCINIVELINKNILEKKALNTQEPVIPQEPITQKPITQEPITQEPITQELVITN